MVMPNWYEEYIAGGAYSLSKAPRTLATELVDTFNRYGWRSTFLHQKKIHRIEDYLLEDYTMDEVITDLVGGWIQQTSPDDTFIDRLIAIGLRHSIAKHLAEIFTPLIDASFTTIQLLELAINYLTDKRKSPLTDGSVPFYIKPDVTNTWIPYKTGQIMNIPASCSVSLQNTLQQILVTTPRNGNHNHYCFHTTSWRAALSILHKLRHSAGHTCQDFGIGPGFYLSNSLGTALDWGEKCMGRFSSEIATVVFSLPKILPKHLNHKHLEGDEWTTVTRSARRCAQDDELKEVEPHAILTGYMVQNPNGIKERNELPRQHSPPKFQLVSRCDIGDAYLQKRIVGCFFFRR